MAKAVQATLSEKLLLNLQEVAAVLGIAPSTVQSWEQEGILPGARRLGGRRLWCRQELEQWCLAGCPPAIEWSKKIAATR